MDRKLLIGLFVWLPLSPGQDGIGLLTRVRNILSSDDVVYSLSVMLDKSDGVKKGGEATGAMDPEAAAEIRAFLQLADLNPQ